MDFADLLLFLLFVALPLLQQLLTKRPPPPPTREPEGVEPAAPEDRVPLPRFPDTPAEPEPWEAEPLGELRELEEVEALAEREVLAEEEAAELAERRSRLPVDVVPEAVRVSAPVVSLEPLRVDRSQPSVRSAPSLPPVRPARRADPRVGALLRDAEGLRRAVLLSEVLGPPRGIDPR